jgi:hypothetical protein
MQSYSLAPHHASELDRLGDEIAELDRTLPSAWGGGRGEAGPHDHGIDLEPVIGHDEVYGRRGPSVREDKAEGPGAVLVHAVAAGRGRAEVGRRHAIERDRVDLREASFPVEGGHGDALQGTERRWTS